MKEAWRLLRTQHAELVEDIADGKRFVWLGSGISLEQVPGLSELLGRVLRFLRDQATSSKPDANHHKDALFEILDEHMPGERQRFEAEQASWEPAGLEQIREKYSRVLSVGVDGKPMDYLLFEAAEFLDVYADPELTPGATHLLIAMLISEGVVTHLASGNWDGLIEKALGEIAGSDQLLDVYVDVNDPRDGNGHAEIAKFHGCAVRARSDPSRYRDKIIATTAQISKMHGDESYAHMKEHLRDLTTRMRSLVLGLSVQDGDLLTIFTGAANRSPWSWEPHHPAYLFAEPGVKPSQRDVLQVAYGEDFERDKRAIVERSALGAYAGPVVAAILIEVLVAKLLVALERQTAISTKMGAELQAGIHRVALRMVSAFGRDEKSLADFMLGGYADFARTYLGDAVASGVRYPPFIRGTRTQLRIDHSVTGMSVDVLAAALGLIGVGELSRRWRMTLSNTNRGSRITLSSAKRGTEVTVVVVRGAREAISAMSSEDWVTSTREMALLQLEVGEPVTNRSPSGRIGRRRGSQPRRELRWTELTDSVRDAQELISRFETGAGL